ADVGARYSAARLARGRGQERRGVPAERRVAARRRGVAGGAALGARLARAAPRVRDVQRRGPRAPHARDPHARAFGVSGKRREKPADVVVVGGGVMGCASAWELAKRGRSVLVLERSVPGAEASSAAAGILGAQVEAHAPGPLAELARASLGLY